MARRKTTKRKTTATKRRPTKRRATRKKGSSGFVNFFVPLFFISCILFCLGFLMFMGYRTATASSFFDMENVETQGVKNIPKEKIKEIVSEHTAKSGVWNADIEAIRSDVEKFKYAKEVSISRVLPDTVRVIVNERVPVAVIRLDGKDFWADVEGKILSRISPNDNRPPFTMFGWSQDGLDRTEKNKKRVELYLKLIESWKSYDLAKRVKAVDLSDLKDAHAIVEKSGRTIEIRLGDKDYENRLQKGIEAVAVSDKCIGYVITSGEKTVTGPCDS